MDRADVDGVPQSGRFEPEPGALGQNPPLVPADSIAGRALVTVIAIMTFLAALAAGAAFLVSEASHGWSDAISREMTIQVRPAPGRDIEDDVAKAAALARAAARHRRGQNLQQGTIRTSPRTLARQRIGARRIADSAAHRRRARAGRPSRFAGAAHGARRQPAFGEPRRSPRVARPARGHGAHPRPHRDRDLRSGARRHGAGGRLRDERRHGGQSRSRRRAAFRRCPRPFHRARISAAFPKARAEGRDSSAAAAPASSFSLRASRRAGGSPVRAATRSKLCSARLRRVRSAMWRSRRFPPEPVC